MSNTPKELRYSKEDEWVKVDGNVATIGITDHAQNALSDIVYLELPSAGDTIAAGDIFGVVESVKAASDLYMPVSGVVTAVNDDLSDAPETINEDPYGASWMLKVELSNPAELDSLMDAASYEKYNATRS